MRVAVSRLAPLAVAAMLALSGCGAFGFGETDTDTLTPVSVPSPERPSLEPTTVTPEPTPSSDSLTIDEISQLGARYETRLQNDSYRLRATQRVRIEGRVVAATILTRRVGAGERTYIEQLHRTDDGLSGTNISYTKFYNGTVSATRIMNDATPTYAFKADPRPPDYLSGRAQLEGLLRAFAIDRPSNASVAESVVFVSENFRNPRALSLPATVEDPRNGTLVLRLYQNGTTTLRASYTVTVEETRTGEVTRTLRVDRRNNISVAAPAWVATARAS